MNVVGGGHEDFLPFEHLPRQEAFASVIQRGHAAQIDSGIRAVPGQPIQMKWLLFKLSEHGLQFADSQIGPRRRSALLWPLRFVADRNYGESLRRLVENGQQPQRK